MLLDSFGKRAVPTNNGRCLCLRDANRIRTGFCLQCTAACILSTLALTKISIKALSETGHILARTKDWEECKNTLAGFQEAFFTGGSDLLVLVEENKLIVSNTTAAKTLLHLSHHTKTR